MSKRGLWVLLGASAVAGAMFVTTGCGDDADPPAAAAGAAGAAGKANTGGKGGGDTAGTGGTAGAAGNSTVIPGRAQLGKACVKDADCKGGKCFTDTAGDFDGASPVGGLCVIDCTEAAKSDDGAGIEATCGAGATCLISKGTVEAPEEAVCVLGCTVGSIPSDGTQQQVQAAIQARCAGRLDMACNADDTGSGFCSPFCSSNPDASTDVGGICPDTLLCDPSSGFCVPPAQLDGLKKTGEACTAGSETRECKGACLLLADLPAGAKTGPGMCADVCLQGLGLNRCEDEGTCLFSLTTDGGLLDLGGCVKKVDAKADADCAWEIGVFATSFVIDDEGNKEAYCVPVADCKDDDECKFECETNDDCGDENGTCVNKKCTISSRKCYTFDSTTSAKSGCVDHQPTVGGAKPVSGGAGAAGAGGASGGAGGASAGAGGAAAGAAGAAAAGAGGAAAGAAGSDAGGAGGASAGAAGTGGLEPFGPRKGSGTPRACRSFFFLSSSFSEPKLSAADAISLSFRPDRVPPRRSARSRLSLFRRRRPQDRHRGAREEQLGHTRAAQPAPAQDRGGASSHRAERLRFGHPRACRPVTGWSRTAIGS